MLDLQRGQKISIQTDLPDLDPWRWSCGIRGPWRSTCPALAWTAQAASPTSGIFFSITSGARRKGAMALSEGASGGTARFQVDLAAPAGPYPAALLFTAAIDGGRSLRELEQGSIGLWVRGEEMAQACLRGERVLRGASHRGRRALPEKTGTGSSAPWAGASTAARALVESFGGVVSDPVPPPPPPVRTAVSARQPGSRPRPPAVRLFRGGHPAPLPPHVCTRMEGLGRRCQGTWTSWRRCTKPPLQHWPRCPGQRRGPSDGPVRRCLRLHVRPCTAGAGSSRCSTSSSPCPPPCQTAAPWTAGPLLRRAASWSR